MKTHFRKLNFIVSALLFLAMLFGLAIPFTVGAETSAPGVDHSPTTPLGTPSAPAEPRYISGIGIDNAYTIFYEDRHDTTGCSSGTYRIYFDQTTTGPLGFAASGTATNICDSHFLVKNWPITISSTLYNYRAWGAGNYSGTHNFYVSNDMVNWTLVTTFTFTHPTDGILYNFHDIVQINNNYIGWVESAGGRTFIAWSDNGDSNWTVMSQVGGATADSAPLSLYFNPGIQGPKPSGNFVLMQMDGSLAYTKLYFAADYRGAFMAINRAAAQATNPADAEAAFMNPANWTWRDGSTGLPSASNAIIVTTKSTGGHDVREGWTGPMTDVQADHPVFYDGSYASGAFGLGWTAPVPNTVWVDDGYSPATCTAAGHTWGMNCFTSLQAGIAAVAAGGTVHIAAGTYTETGQIVIAKNLTVIGEDKATTIIKPAADTIGTGDTGSWILVNDGITFNLSSVTLDGVGRQIRQGIRYNGSGTVDDAIIQNMVQTGYMGFGIAQGFTNTNPRTLTVTNSTFSNFGRVGVQADNGTGGSEVLVSGNTFICNGPGDMVNYGVTVEGGAHATISNNTFMNCQGIASTDDSESAAIEASTYFAPGTEVVITGNLMTNNLNGILIGYYTSDSTVVTLHNNLIYDNTKYGVFTTNSSMGVDAINNYWGDASGPSGIGPGSGDAVSEGVLYDPWCVNLVCITDPPPTPSSFWGYIHFMDGAPSIGSILQAEIPGMIGPARSVSLADAANYAFNVPGDIVGTSEKEGGIENDAITFKLDGRVVATGVWNGGTNVKIDFHPPQALPGTYAALVNTPVSLNGSANDWGISNATPADTVTYAWDLDNNGSYETPGQAFSRTWTAVGDYIIGLQVTDAQGAVGTATTTVHIASITLGSLTQVYDGTPKAATATTNPASLPVNFAYTPTDPPVNVGSYGITASITGYTGSVTGTLVIAPATATITLSNLNPVYTGSPLGVTVTTTPPGVGYIATYSGSGYGPSTTPPTEPGTYMVTVEINDPNYTGTPVSATMHIQKQCTINLVAGWNLVSLCLAQVNTAPGTVLSSLNGKYDLVYGWDGSVGSNNWLKFSPSGPPYANNMPILNEKMGFWVHITQATSLIVTGYPPVSTTIPLSTAGGGWNLVGYPSLTSRSLMTPPGTHAGLTDFTLIYAYHAADGIDPWKLFDISAPDFVDDLTSLTANWGYWIKVTSSYDWSVIY